MRTRWLILALVGGLVTGVLAQRTVTFERFDVADTAVGLTLTTLDPAGAPPITWCEGRIETAQIRVADRRAVAVSATTGRVLEVGDVLTFESHDAAVNARFMKTGSTTGVVQMACEAR